MVLWKKFKISCALYAILMVSFAPFFRVLFYLVEQLVSTPFNGLTGKSSGQQSADKVFLAMRFYSTD